MASATYRRGRFVVDRYEFQTGGDSEVVLCDFVYDKSQGFGVPARSFYIENLGGGEGLNYIYFQTTETGKYWSRVSTLLPDSYENNVLNEAVFYGVRVWASNARCMFSLVAAPGEWSDDEIRQVVSGPIGRRAIDILIEEGI